MSLHVRTEVQRAILSFRGAFHFLSNFYPSNVIYDGQLYPTVEHAYQAAKTTNKETRTKIRCCLTPGSAKKMGQQRVNLRPDWAEIKVSIMRELIRNKFQNNPKLKTQLLWTNKAALIEGNNWGDTFWGQVNGVGENMLGKILMEVREELSRETLNVST